MWITNAELLGLVFNCCAVYDCEALVRPRNHAGVLVKFQCHEMIHAYCADHGLDFPAKPTPLTRRSPNRNWDASSTDVSAPTRPQAHAQTNFRSNSTDGNFWLTIADAKSWSSSANGSSLSHHASSSSKNRSRPGRKNRSSAGVPTPRGTTTRHLGP